MTRPQTTNFWRGSLPHWEVVDGRYFVTLRVANSLPASVERELSEVLRDATERDCLMRSRKYFSMLERWLDSDRKNMVLADPEVAKVVATAISAYEERGYWQVSAYAIMPNHVHMFLRCGTLGLGDLMRRFKHATARATGIARTSGGARRSSASRPQGRQFWQREWFDHWSRDAVEDERIRRYIHLNPVRAGLGAQFCAAPWMR